MTDMIGRRSTSKTKVLWLIKGLGPGGAENLLISQARVHDRANFEIHAAYLVPWKNHLVGDLEANGVAVTLLDGPHEWDPRWLWRLRKFIITKKIEVIHVHSPYVAALTRLTLRTISKRHRPAIVTTEHNRWPRHNRLTRLANRVTLGLDDATIAVSEDVRTTMPAVHRDKIEVITHGVNLDRIRSLSEKRDALRVELGFEFDDVIVCIVANFRREKAYEVLIEAATIALRQTNNLQFVAVGQGPLEDEMRALIQENRIADRFTILGYRDDAAAVIASADIFTLTSRHEGLPVSLMEALALGLPVVATSVGGIPEMVKGTDSAILVPPNEPQALADAYSTLACDPSRRQVMGAAAYSTGDKFGIEPAQRRLEEVYTTLARSRRS